METNESKGILIAYTKISETPEEYIEMVFESDQNREKVKNFFEKEMGWNTICK